MRQKTCWAWLLAASIITEEGLVETNHDTDLNRNAISRQMTELQNPYESPSDRVSARHLEQGWIGIRFHQWIGIFVTLCGFLMVAVLLAATVVGVTLVLGYLGGDWAAIVLMVPMMVAAAIGSILGTSFIHRCYNAIPARCPECGGKSYPMRHYRVAYECSSCEHNHSTRSK